MRTGSLDVAAMGETDPPPNALNDVDEIVCRIGRQRTGAEGDAVGTAVDNVDNPLEGFAAGDDARQSENCPWWIIGMQCHRHPRAGRHGNDALQKVREVLPETAFVDGSVCI